MHKIKDWPDFDEVIKKAESANVYGQLKALGVALWAYPDHLLVSTSQKYILYEQKMHPGCS